MPMNTLILVVSAQEVGGSIPVSANPREMPLPMQSSSVDSAE